jgi:hypothetical protein
MLLDDVTRFELYRDTSEADPYEDPEKIRDRLESLARRADAELETTDLAGDSRAERMDRLEAVRSRVDDGKPYVVDNRMFKPETFGSRRPALVVEYEDGGTDVYPHRNFDVDGNVPIAVSEALDELAGEDQAPADLEEVHAEDQEDDATDDGTITTPAGAIVRVAQKAIGSITSS